MASAWGSSWGVAWGVSWGDPGVTPPTPTVPAQEVSWPLWQPNKRKVSDETTEQRRARAFAEMADDLESIQPDAKAAEIKRQITRIEKAARKAAEDVAEAIADRQLEEFMSSLRTLRQQRAAESIAAQQKIALEYARAIEAVLLRRAEEDAIVALLLA